MVEEHLLRIMVEILPSPINFLFVCYLMDIAIVLGLTKIIGEM